MKKIAFRTYDGYYKFSVISFGFSNAPMTFLSLMNDVYRSYLREFLFVLFDDILVYNR